MTELRQPKLVRRTEGAFLARTTPVASRVRAGAKEDGRLDFGAALPKTSMRRDCGGPGEATSYASVMSSALANPSDHDDSVTQELNERLHDAYDENGVDRSLIRWSLARSPTERVMAVEEALNALATVRRIDPPR